MSKQLLIYETAVPVSAARHGKHSIEVGGTYTFSAGVNAVPLMAVEILRAATEYAVVFTAVGDDVMPAVVLGVKGDQNLYLGPDGHWNAKYIPAFIRRYPFVFAASADAKTLTLCVDEAYPGLNTEGRGQRLFGDDGRPTAYVDRVLTFLKEYQAHFVRTQTFGRRLKAAGVLEPMQAKVTTPAGATLSLTGFMAVNRAKLRALSGDQLAELAKTDELELIYLHLYSMRNFADVKDRLIGTLPADAEDAKAPAA
ncbi:MAG TPA: SapC family protein [Burkholderiaceae bacterium]|nr:SapC family protein [Burkholderiaceae bacterium]